MTCFPDTGQHIELEGHVRQEKFFLTKQNAETTKNFEINWPPNHLHFQKFMAETEKFASTTSCGIALISLPRSGLHLETPFVPAFGV